jgi:hypothetical protein
MVEYLSTLSSADLAFLRFMGAAITLGVASLVVISGHIVDGSLLGVRAGAAG